ncbi:MAG: YqiJ family protein [Pseudomonadota bacterium]
MDAGTGPFIIALMAMGLIALLEVGGLLFGVAFSGLIENALPDLGDIGDADMELDGAEAGVETETGADGARAGVFASLLSWLCVGRVPILILLAAFLCAFGLSGLALQGIATSIFGAALPVGLASLAALIPTLPTTRAIGLTVSRIMPKEETDAVSTTSFVGRVATVIRGVARTGAPAEAKVVGGRGRTHYILLEPEEPGVSFGPGAAVLITEKNGATFRGIANETPALAPNKD